MRSGCWQVVQYGGRDSFALWNTTTNRFFQFNTGRPVVVNTLHAADSILTSLTS